MASELYAVFVKSNNDRKSPLTTELIQKRERVFWQTTFATFRSEKWTDDKWCKPAPVALAPHQKPRRPSFECVSNRPPGGLSALRDRHQLTKLGHNRAVLRTAVGESR